MVIIGWVGQGFINLLQCDVMVLRIRLPHYTFLNIDPVHESLAQQISGVIQVSSETTDTSNNKSLH